MISTVYLHPDRTLRATWSVEDGEATLLSFDDNAQLESAGVDDHRAYETTYNNERIVLHSSKVLFHRYPVDADEDHARRRFFEIITCLPPLSTEDHIIDIAMPGTLHGSARTLRDSDSGGTRWIFSHAVVH
mgnify:CR=1 FL=1